MKGSESSKWKSLLKTMGKDENDGQDLLQNKY